MSSKSTKFDQSRALGIFAGLLSLANIVGLIYYISTNGWEWFDIVYIVLAIWFALMSIASFWVYKETVRLDKEYQQIVAQLDQVVQEWIAKQQEQHPDAKFTYKIERSDDQ